MSYQHWQLEYTPSQKGEILFLGFDRANKSTNTISESVLDELNQIIDEVDKQHNLAGLVFISLKENGFIAGADVEGFKDLDSPEKLGSFLRKGQSLFNRIAALPLVTIAAIKGFCMGGGLELALACDHRIACDDEKTRLGLPEVKLGIMPGWGGTVRSVQLVGTFAAMDLMLTGRALTVSNAKRIGLVDAKVPLRQFKRTAIYFVEHKPKKTKPGFFKRILTTPFFRNLIQAYLKSKVSKKANQSHYPAPFEIIRVWSENGGADLSRSYEAEIEAITGLLFKDSQTARNLIRVFYLQEQLKSLSKLSDFKAKHVHVIGAGTMGGDIAAWCALRGLRVTLQDQDIDRIAPAIKRAAALFKKRLKKPILINAAMDRLIPDVIGSGVMSADVIIEAVFEDLSVKQNLLKDLEKKAKSDAILATNTSSIPLDEINAVMEQPERLIGIHYFNPVALMPLVEIVVSDKTSEETEFDAIAFVRQIDKLPLPVKSRPGFLVNRVLMPYLMEAVVLVSEGCSIQEVDKAAIEFGMPMGPVELADKVGLDVCLSVAQNLVLHYGGQIPGRLEELVASGDLGIKSGRGFYQYKNGKLIRHESTSSTALSREAIAHRLILRMLNEAAACLREGIIQNVAHLDAGMIFGTGFAPFRGGLSCYADSIGFKELSELYQEYESRYGERFKADKGLDQLNDVA